MLTLYVIPCDNPEQANIQKLKESAEGVADRVEVLDHRRLDEVEPETEWYAFLFSNEWLDEGLKFALPVFLEQTDSDYLILYKKVVENNFGTLVPRTFIVPRIFRSNIKLIGNDRLVPVGQEDLRFLQVLDGWILEPTRVIQ